MINKKNTMIQRFFFCTHSSALSKIKQRISLSVKQFSIITLDISFVHAYSTAAQWAKKGFLKKILEYKLLSWSNLYILYYIFLCCFLKKVFWGFWDSVCVDCAVTPVVDGVEITTSFFSLRQVYSLGFANLSSSVRPAAQRGSVKS